MRLVDYQADPEASRMAINDWVESQTNDRIVDLIPEGSCHRPHPTGAGQRHLLQGKLAGASLTRPKPRSVPFTLARRLLKRRRR